MNEETTRDILSCKDRDDLEKLLCKYKEKSLNARMKYDPAYATLLHHPFLFKENQRKLKM